MPTSAARPSATALENAPLRTAVGQCRQWSETGRRQLVFLETPMTGSGRQHQFAAAPGSRRSARGPLPAKVRFRRQRRLHADGHDRSFAILSLSRHSLASTGPNWQGTRASCHCRHVASDPRSLEWQRLRSCSWLCFLGCAVREFGCLFAQHPCADHKAGCR